MAEVGSAYAEGFGVSTTAGPVDLCQIPAGSFTAGKTYLLLAWASVASASVTNDATVSLVHGASDTVFTDALGDLELNAANTHKAFQGWMFVYTQPGTAEEVTLRLGSTGGSSATADGGILAICLTDCGTEDVVWRYNEVTADYTPTTTPTAQASETFTPNGTDTWLLLAHGVVDPASSTANQQMQLNDSVVGVVSAVDVEGEDTTNERRQWALAHAYTPSNAAHTVSARFSYESGGTAGNVLSSRVFAMNLTAIFAQVAFTFAAAEEQPAAAASWTTTRTLSPTPAVTGNWAIIAAANHDLNSLSNDTRVRLQVNPSGGGLTSQPGYGDDAPGIDGWDATDVTPVLLATRESLSSGAARDINFDTQSGTGTSQRVENRLLVAFSLEAAVADVTEAGTIVATVALAATERRATTLSVDGTDGAVASIRSADLFEDSRTGVVGDPSTEYISFVSAFPGGTAVGDIALAYLWYDFTDAEFPEWCATWIQTNGGGGAWTKIGEDGESGVTPTKNAYYSKTITAGDLTFGYAAYAVADGGDTAWTDPKAMLALIIVKDSTSIGTVAPNFASATSPDLTGYVDMLVFVTKGGGTPSGNNPSPATGLSFQDLLGSWVNFEYPQKIDDGGSAGGPWTWSQTGAADTVGFYPTPGLPGILVVPSVTRVKVVPEAGTITATVALSKAEVLREVGTVTAVGALSAVEDLVTGDEIEAGTVTAACALSATETLNEPGTLAAAGSLAAAETISEAATLTATVALSSTETATISEAGAFTAVSVMAGQEAAAEAASVSPSVTATAVEVLTEAATLAAVATLTATEASDTSDTGTVTAAAVLTAAEALVEASTVAAASTITGTEVAAEASTLTAVSALSAVEDLTSGDEVEAGTITATASLSAIETLTEAGTVTCATALTAAEASSETATLTAVGVLSATETASVSETGTVTAVSSHAHTEAHAETGTATAISALAGAAATAESVVLSAIIQIQAAETLTEAGTIVGASILFGGTQQRAHPVADITDGTWEAVFT